MISPETCLSLPKENNRDHTAFLEKVQRFRVVISITIPFNMCVWPDSMKHRRNGRQPTENLMMTALFQMCSLHRSS